MKTDAIAQYLDRLARVERRLAEHAARPIPSGLTDPDPGATERWEAGQVWAHLAEFPGYWLEQFRGVLDAHAAGAAEPFPFGRTHTDAGRLAAIERERRTDPAELLRRVIAQIGDVSAALTSLPAGAWEARGLHPTRGEMVLPAMVDRFILGHLEEHADQLDGLELVTLDEIRQAAARIRGVAIHTPLLRWDDRTWLKPESLQPVGAFKMRGAYNAVASLTDAERARGVVSYSSGNHAQAVARAARLLGARAVIVMPDSAPQVKVDGVRRDGAEIVFTGPGSEERHRIALDMVERERYVMIEPYDDRRIIAGQGTCGLEIAEDLPGVT
ncbi:MAG TPA: pyridoxal-phosphate dependent enzyme, partial [Candidatus Dormibacteraeota bacterium]|nr:pyridoxal-phosphate dependent enzyme [Candidatus Dormibacteraeota bacterium]